MAALLLSVAIPAVAQQTANDAAGKRQSGRMAIVEFRADGPGPAPGTGSVSDEYVEICNISNGTFTILSDTADANGKGLGVFSYQQNTNNVIYLFSIPNGIIFQPGQCYLGANNNGAVNNAGGANAGYSLGAYAAPDAAFLNQVGTTTTAGRTTGVGPGPSITTDGIPSDTGVLVLGTDTATFGTVGGLPAACLSGGCTGAGANVGLATIVDAVGFNVAPTITFPGTPAPNSPLFREGTGLNPIAAQSQASTKTVQYAWVRRFCGTGGGAFTGGTCGQQQIQGASPGSVPNDVNSGGVIQDSDNNNQDFFGSESGSAATDPQTGGTVTASGRPVAPTSTANTNNANPGPVTFSSFGLPAANFTPVVAMLGAPAPESFTASAASNYQSFGSGGNGAAVGTAVPAGTVVIGSPRKRRFNSNVAQLNFSTALFDTTSGAQFTVPNRERVSAVPKPTGTNPGVPADNNEASSPQGTFALRFTITNNTGQTINRLRIRMVDLTTDNRPTANEVFFNQPGGAPSSSNPQAILRLISSTTARVFVGTGADQNCTAASNATSCAGSGFKLVQGLMLETNQPQGTSAGNGAGNTIPAGAPLGNGINGGLIVENNTNAAGATPAATNAAALSPAGVAAYPAGFTQPNNNAVVAGGGTLAVTSGIPRGTGTLLLNPALANGNSMSIELRFGVQQVGRFYIQVIPEADSVTGGGAGATVLP
jgi:hypothetical protein